MSDNERENCESASSCGRSSCEGCPSAKGNGGAPDFSIENNPGSNIKHVIGVVSGKGGVGKSFVTASMAGLMRRAGYEVGILDADITGPSIPKMFGVSGPLMANETGSFPAKASDGTKIMSINLLLDSDDAPVIWRGPVLAGVVKQFWTDVIWGDVDYLFVDMPPGTGDVPLTAFQSLPLDGIVIVTSPQELVQMIVKKAYNMAQMMDIPVLGVVENFSYMTCPDCGKRLSVFGESRVEAAAGELNIPVLGKLPILPEVAKLSDQGMIYAHDAQDLAGVKEILEGLS